MSIKDVLSQWSGEVAVSQTAHSLAADHFSHKRYSLGVPVICLTTLVGTSVFAMLQKLPELWVQVTVGLASALAAVLAGLQTFLDFAGRAEGHRTAAAKYGAIERELQVLLSSNVDPSAESVTALGRRLDGIASESPHNPTWVDRYARAKLQAPVSGTGELLLQATRTERLKQYFLAAYIAFLIAGAAGGSKLMPLGPFAAAVTVLSFAVTVLILDCVNQLFGEEEAKRFVAPGFFSLLLATGSMWIFVHVPFASIHSPDYKSAYALILLPPFRMFVAGLAAYLVGQLLNIYVFGKIRKKTTFKQRGARNVGSTLCSQFVDPLVFVPAAFWGLYGITLEGVWRIFVGQFVIKALVAVFFSLPVFIFLTRLFRGTDLGSEA